jgi:hypothetical protein
MSCPIRINTINIECPESLKTAYALSDRDWSGGELILQVRPEDYTPLKLNESSRYGGAALKVTTTRRGFEVTVRRADARVRAALEELATISEYNTSGQHAPIRVRDFVAPDWQAIKANIGNPATLPFIQRYGLIPRDLIDGLPTYRGKSLDQPVLREGFKFTFHDWELT